MGLCEMRWKQRKTIPHIDAYKLNGNMVHVQTRLKYHNIVDGMSTR